MAIVARMQRIPKVEECVPEANSEVTPHQLVRSPPMLEAGVEILQRDYHSQASLEGRCHGADH